VRLAVVSGLRDEAACLAAAPPGVAVACAGPGPANAVAAARRLLDFGAQALVSFGVAGALAPIVRPGRLLLPREIVLADGSRYAVDQGLRAQLANRLGALAPLSEALAGSDAAVLTVSAKRVLRQATGAVAVDMESHALARLAEERRIPFLAVRAVADAADADVPPLALAGMMPDGTTRAWPVIRGLVARPRELPGLLRLAGHMRLATAALRRAAPALAALAEIEEERS
jgi:adenosylhomocysteine nucleosidase